LRRVMNLVANADNLHLFQKFFHIFITSSMKLRIKEIHGYPSFNALKTPSNTLARTHNFSLPNPQKLQ
ncbi:hypothetical protein DD595_25960, partial [Enterobacter cloacae complex sp. 4DZ3-17B2]|uniref:hypothetical protein n=1 Tax=Enterobacter cloacae complex sp. 4DZ3-17B2 TaxID=2511990 RepID=UPI001025CCE1